MLISWHCGCLSLISLHQKSSSPSLLRILLNSTPPNPKYQIHAKTCQIPPNPKYQIPLNPKCQIPLGPKCKIHSLAKYKTPSTPAPTLTQKNTHTISWNTLGNKVLKIALLRNFDRLHQCSECILNVFCNFKEIHRNMLKSNRSKC